MICIGNYMLLGKNSGNRKITSGEEAECYLNSRNSQNCTLIIHVIIINCHDLLSLNSNGHYHTI